jgi:hypothetical protein
MCVCEWMMPFVRHQTEAVLVEVRARAAYVAGVVLAVAMSVNHAASRRRRTTQVENVAREEVLVEEKVGMTVARVESQRRIASVENIEREEFLVGEKALQAGRPVVRLRKPGKGVAKGEARAEAS